MNINLSTNDIKNIYKDEYEYPIKTIIVFPKPFEFHKFLMSLRVYEMILNGDFIELVFECQGVKIAHILVINESDIAFTLKLIKLLTKYKRANWMMIGSCGLDIWPDFDLINKGWIHDELFKVYWVKSATKFDRGTLHGTRSDYHFCVKNDKLIEAKHNKIIPICGPEVDVFVAILFQMCLTMIINFMTWNHMSLLNCVNYQEQIVLGF